MINRILLFSFLILILNSCRSEDEELRSDFITFNDFQFILVDSFERQATSCRMVDSSIILKQSSFLRFEDFASYNSKRHTFKLSSSGVEAFNNMQFPVNGVPFAVFANGTFIYSGYFWPIYSSLACDAITIESSQILSRKELVVQMGHPNLFYNIPEDKRNDPAIIEIFRAGKKLIEK